MVLKAGEVIRLTHLEFELLIALINRQGETVSRLALLQDVWGYTGRRVSRTVDTHIVRLRKRLESNPHRPTLILTVPKTGYRLSI